IFMVRVRDDDYWTIFSPMDTKISLGYNLNGLYGQKFNNAYIRCEVELKCKKMIKARKLFFDIIKMQCNTGESFLFFIDNTNKKSNQSNIGPIVILNLCTEIVEHTENISVCNLRAVILPNHISSENEFDFTELQYSVRLLVNSLGVIGLATLYKKLRYSWEDKKACELNKKIFANMYYAVLDESCNLAREHSPYDNYEGSSLLKEYGVRNSLLIAPMLTTSTSQCVGTGYSEGPFPDESNLMFRETTGGSFIYVEREMAEMLISKGLWTPKIIDKILDNNGSVQDIKEFPEEMKAIYKTAFEYSYETIIDHAIDRSLYID
ncbi:25930_t:CDS:2, partial [Racocetra persica]